jgi:hypothetical protein
MTKPLSEKNPFEMVYSGIWDLARQNPALMEWIPEGNQIDFESWIGPKDDLADADLPQLTLLPSSTFSNLRSTSTSTRVQRVYTWALLTGSFEINCVYNKIQWELFRAMVDVCNCLLTLEWNEEKFVKSANFQTSTEGTFFGDDNKLIRGWSLGWPIEVGMEFTRSKIQLKDCTQ